MYLKYERLLASQEGLCYIHLI